MAAKKILSWLQTGWTNFVDPEREERLTRQVSSMHKELAAKRGEFDLTASVSRLEISQEDIPEVTRRLYCKCLSSAWNDDELTDKEHRSLTQIATLLRLPPSMTNELMREEGARVFEKTLARAFEDGVLDDKEYAALERIAASCNTTPADFLRNEFCFQGESFIRGLFLKIWEDGRLESHEWREIVTAIRRIGMTEAEFKQSVRASAEQLVEHFLADYKTDGIISPEEETFLEWMLANLIDSTEIATYVREEIRETKRFSAIRSGLLPSISCPSGIAIKAGELTHFVAPCRYSFVKKRTSDNVTIHVDGTGIVTDDRFLFVSSEHSLQLIHSRILGAHRVRHGLEINASGKGAGIYRFLDDSRAGMEIWLIAIGKANQTILAPKQNDGSRHISRDVRQRVFQRYGGRCAECNATQYLKFDHIIPVARGGSNSDANVQLLCRACNLKKSDAI
jgi:hypothetical protein